MMKLWYSDLMIKGNQLVHEGCMNKCIVLALFLASSINAAKFTFINHSTKSLEVKVACKQREDSVAMEKHTFTILADKEQTCEWAELWRIEIDGRNFPWDTNNRSASGVIVLYDPNESYWQWVQRGGISCAWL